MAGIGQPVRLDARRIKSFWTAEEVPRWIGMSLVAILLFGMVGVSHWSAESARNARVGTARDDGAAAVELLAWSLSRSEAGDTRGQQAALRAFALRHNCEQLRVYDPSQRVLASINQSEIGGAMHADVGKTPATPVSVQTDVLPSRLAGADRWVVTAPIPSVTTTAGESGVPTRFVQCVQSVSGASVSDGGRVGVAAIIVMAVGTLLIVYRLMRRHFRSMTRISENLLLRGEPLEEDLTSLRLADGEGALVSQWNRLIDLVDDLSASARRATASVELKEALENSQGGALAEMVNAIPDGLLHVADGDRLVYVNAMARRLLLPDGGEGAGIENESLASLEVCPTGQSVIGEVRGALSGDGAFRSVSKVIEADGGGSSYRVRVLPFNTSKSRGECVVTIADVSQQVRSERAAEEFVSQVTHELRTPLTNIRAYAETLSSGMFEDPQVVTECYNVITKETRRLSRLIEDILSMSQLEVGSIQLRLDSVDLRSLLTEAVRDLRALADDKGVDMQVTLPSKLPAMQGDRDKLSVVLNNLLGNALKYTPSGGSVQVGCQVTSEEVLITVKDTGMGLDPAEHERIFEKFQRGSSPEVEEITGTGIGLTTAREIVRRHGGAIQVMSREGEGATFAVHLPLTESRVRRDAAPA